MNKTALFFCSKYCNLFKFQIKMTEVAVMFVKCETRMKPTNF